jgi:phospholipid/cholesterol/gamma-HCH transport system ATP-binding protein
MSDSTLKNIPAIEFRHVFVSFDDVEVLSDVSFRLERGEMILLTGVSGSGKSVLLRLAIGLLRPDKGEILIAGREIQTLDETHLLAIRGGLMGMVFQEDTLFTGLSVYDNTSYRLEEHGWSKEDIDRAVREVLRFVGLEEEVDKLPEELSGGMKRRLEIARALIGWPSIMLFDEPTMSLDPLVAVQVLNLIIRARDIDKISSLYVTKKVYELPYLAHYRAFEESLTSERGSTGFSVELAPDEERPRTKVVVLDKGQVAFTGSVEEFQLSNLPAIKELITLDHHNHENDPYFPDPWDKRRRPKEEIL